MGAELRRPTLGQGGAGSCCPPHTLVGLILPVLPSSPSLPHHKSSYWSPKLVYYDPPNHSAEAGRPYSCGVVNMLYCMFVTLLAIDTDILPVIWLSGLGPKCSYTDTVSCIFMESKMHSGLITDYFESSFPCNIMANFTFMCV